MTRLQSTPSSASCVVVLASQLFRIKLRPLLAWTASLVALIVLMLAIYPSMTSAVDYAELMKSYPENLKKAFGIEGTGGLDTASGYLDMELFGLLLPLAIVFLPTGYVTRAITTAEERGFLEVLLSLPVRRWQVVASAAVASATGLAVALLAMFGAGILTAQIGGIDLGSADMARSCIALWPLASFFAVVALLVASASGSAHPTAIAAGLLVFMYLLNVVAGFTTSLGDLNQLSIFHYYSDWLKDGVGWQAGLTVLGICMAMTVAAAALFERRDVV